MSLSFLLFRQLNIIRQILSYLQVCNAVDYLINPLEPLICESLNEPSKVNLKLPKVKHCSRFCREECDNFVSSLSVSEKDSFFSEFKCRKKDFKAKLLNHLKVQEKVGVSQFGICFKNHIFCPNSFCQVTGKSLYLVKKVLRDHSDGVLQYFSNVNKSMSTATLYFITWMRVFSLKYGQDDPTSKVTVLPSYLYKGNASKASCLVERSLAFQ